MKTTENRNLHSKSRDEDQFNNDYMISPGSSNNPNYDNDKLENLEGNDFLNNMNSSNNIILTTNTNLNYQDSISTEPSTGNHISDYSKNIEKMNVTRNIDDSVQNFLFNTYGGSTLICNILNGNSYLNL